MLRVAKEKENVKRLKGLNLQNTDEIMRSLKIRFDHASMMEM